MKNFHRIRGAGGLLFLLLFLLASCRVWLPPASKSLNGPAPVAPEQLTALPLQEEAAAVVTETPAVQNAAVSAEEAPARFLTGEQEPAGCLSAVDQEALGGIDGRLNYAQRLLAAENVPILARSLESRRLTESVSAYGAADRQSDAVLTLSVGDIQPGYLLQRVLNALQVAGFVTWLRSSPAQDVHILAIAPDALVDPLDEAVWQPYVDAYWRDRTALPNQDSTVIPVMKLPPCAWQTAAGAAPVVNAWWKDGSDVWPDYADPAAAFLAETNAEAAAVAQRIDWLGQEGEEGPGTMCGPLSWAIMNSAEAFPPEWGDWSNNPRSFWLAKPSENGRPWQLFPAEDYQVYAFKERMSEFNFKKFPLYPGDFVYAYSKGDGFDHMFLVTEVDENGNVYSVTNVTHMLPEKWVSIDHVLLYNQINLNVGMIRNQWANDWVNGRTGHAGFEVFRWAWMVKDITGQAAEVVIQPGDTLGLLAERWKTPVNEIARYNILTSDQALSVGQTLYIPATARVNNP